MNNRQQEQQEQKLLEKFNRARKRIIRNKLIIITILNFLTFLAFVFAMGYYKWCWVKFDYSSDVDPYQDVDLVLWVNLLYVKADMPESTYRNFGSYGREVCNSNIYCAATLYELAFVGYVCFCIFVLAGILQLYDFARLFYLIWKAGKIIQSKDNFRHILTIFTYLMGITLSGFSIMVIDPTQYKFGISFWMGVGTLSVFVLVIFYQQYSIRKMIQQSLIVNLLQRQKKVRAEEIKHNIDIEMTIKTLSQDDGITL